MKKYQIIIISITLFFIFPTTGYSIRGQCSHHGGVCGGGCCDEYSSSSEDSSSSYNYTPSSSSYSSEDSSSSRGCCSHHGGVCGGRCCDGSDLSLKCRARGSSSEDSNSSYHIRTPAKISYQCNGVLVSEDEFEKCNNAPTIRELKSNDQERSIHHSSKMSCVCNKILNDNTFLCNHQKVSLYGVDSPRETQPFHKEAQDLLNRLIYKKKLTVAVYSKGDNGEKISLVFAGKQNVNEMMVRTGSAWVYTDSCNESFCDKWVKLEEEANSQKIGLWNNPDRLPPWVW